MKHLFTKRNLLGSVLIAFMLSGCGGGGGSTGADPGTESPAASSSVTLNWNSPSTRIDGSVMTTEEVAGYKIHYGSSSGNYSTVIDVGNVTSYTVDALTAGTYYFSVTAYDLNGNESPGSTEISGAI